MVDNNYKTSDVFVDSGLALDLIPYLSGFDSKWNGVESQVQLEKALFFKDLMSHLRNQFRKHGKWLDEKIQARKQERSEEAHSKGNKKSQGSSKGKTTNGQKSLKKAVGSKRQKIKDQDDDRTVSENKAQFLQTNQEQVPTDPF